MKEEWNKDLEKKLKLSMLKKIIKDYIVVICLLCIYSAVLDCIKS